jgi:hypothetical protein
MSNTPVNRMRWLAIMAAILTWQVPLAEAGLI